MSNNSGDMEYAEEGIYERTRTRYLARVEQWQSGRRISIWVGVFILALALIGVGTIIPGGNYVSTIFGIAAGVLVASILIGVKHLRALGKETLTLRERLSPRKRTRIGLITALLGFIIVGFASTSIPYAAGGAILLTIFIMIGDFIRLTPDEKYRQQEQILDPRDFDEEPVYVEPEAVAADFTWDESSEFQDVVPETPTPTDHISGNYPPPVLEE